jgi:hypothetical protein
VHIIVGKLYRKGVYRKKEKKRLPTGLFLAKFNESKHTGDAGRIYNHVDCERLQLFDPGNSVLAGKVTVLFWRVHMNKRMFY